MASPQKSNAITAPAEPTVPAVKTAKELEDSLMMPPPPNPTKNIILEPEINALAECLKNAVAQTGLVYKFYATARKHGIRNVQPPRSITAALGREVEKYDQLCDSLEAQLLRAISVLQRDLSREEKRIEDEKAALSSKKEQEEAPLVPLTEEGASSTQALKEAATLPSLPNSSPMSSSHPGRRASAISISSLHRPAFPHKLDLSSTSFRMPTSEESAIFQSGLASPVTLAPKSARALGPNELPSDFLAAFGTTSTESGSRPPDIDLLPDVMHDHPQPPTSTHVDLTAGDSSDKPIELDLDIDMDVASMSDLFGDDPDSAGVTQEHIQGSDSLFSPALVGSQGGDPSKETDFFDVGENHEEALFSALASGRNETGGADSGASKDDHQANASVPSPGTLLANFGPTANIGHDAGNTEAEHSFNFDHLDLSLGAGFFSGAVPSDMTFGVDFEMGDVGVASKAPTNTSNPS